MQTSESSRVRDRRSTTEPPNQLIRPSSVIVCVVLFFNFLCRPTYYFHNNQQNDLDYFVTVMFSAKGEHRWSAETDRWVGRDLRDISHSGQRQGHVRRTWRTVRLFHFLCVCFVFAAVQAMGGKDGFLGFCFLKPKTSKFINFALKPLFFIIILFSIYMNLHSLSVYREYRLILLQ